MRRKRIITVAAMVTVAGTAVALTLPAVADTRPSADRRAPAVKASPDDIAPQILAAMKRDRGVDPGQARALIKRSEWAAETTADLRAETGASYAGSWLATDGMTLNVAVTDAEAAAEVLRTGGTPRLVRRSEHELDLLKVELDESASSSDRNLPGWYVDAPTNTVVILAAPGDVDRAEALAVKAGLPANAVTVRTTPGKPRIFADVQGGNAYFIDNNARCSVGFSVQGGFVTAGHCGAEGDRVTAEAASSDLLGTVEASVFPGSADMGFVETVNGTDLQPFVNDQDGNLLAVAGSEEAPVGAAVCRSGSTTGTECGRITSKNRTVNYGRQVGVVTGLTGTDVCAEGGDSGGSWLSGDQAQGVTSGGAGDCGDNRDNAETFFQPVNEILTENNLTLLTTEDGDGGNGGNGDGGNGDGGNGDGGNGDGGNGDGGNGDGGNGDGGNGDGGNGGAGGQSVDCTDLAARRQGTISSRERSETQPDGRFFRAGAGLQMACLDVPAGANFGLVLQQFTAGGGFRTVARGTGEGDKVLTFDGEAGTYRYGVVRNSGTGPYTLAFDVQ